MSTVSTRRRCNCTDWSTPWNHRIHWNRQFHRRNSSICLSCQLMSPNIPRSLPILQMAPVRVHKSCRSTSSGSRSTLLARKTLLGETSALSYVRNKYITYTCGNSGDVGGHKQSIRQRIGLRSANSQRVEIIVIVVPIIRIRWS
jgi:hypothetical protein